MILQLTRLKFTTQCGTGDRDNIWCKSARKRLVFQIPWAIAPMMDDITQASTVQAPLWMHLDAAETIESCLIVAKSRWQRHNAIRHFP
jgi:hypothetical protein